MKYITTPIYYANDIPHIGHAVTTLAADVLNRYYQLRGEETFLLTGTDEHGAKIAEAARKASQEPQAFVDSIAPIFAEVWQSLNISVDGFIRTTDPKHEAVVQTFLQNLYDKGHIYQGSYNGWYCVGCEEFKTETQIGPGNTCLIHLRPLVEVEEEAYLFKLSVYKQQLVDLITSDQLKIRPESRKNEVLGFLTHEELKDIAISRKNVAWGIPVPWDKAHTVYVWIDALLAYYSAYDSEGPAFESGHRATWPPHLHLIGKDILRFHAIIWPALLLAAEKELPKELFVHGYFTINGQKISKSLGNVILPQELIDRYGVDATRYLLLAAVPFGNDGDISLERLDSIYTSDLANNLGNLVNRFQTMLTKYQEGRINDSTITEVQKEIAEAVSKDYLEISNPTEALSKIISWASSLNRYIEINQPWLLAKGDEKKLESVLFFLAENIFLLAVALYPFLPQTSAKILSIFGSSINEINYDRLLQENHTAGRTISPIEPLFPRLNS